MLLDAANQILTTCDDARLWSPQELVATEGHKIRAVSKGFLHRRLMR
jgi:hypothetical protein